MNGQCSYEQVYDDSVDTVLLRLARRRERDTVQQIQHAAHDAVSDILRTVYEAIQQLPRDAADPRWLDAEAVCGLLGYHDKETR